MIDFSHLLLFLCFLRLPSVTSFVLCRCSKLVRCEGPQGPCLLSRALPGTWTQVLIAFKTYVGIQSVFPTLDLISGEWGTEGTEGTEPLSESMVSYGLTSPCLCLLLTSLQPSSTVKQTLLMPCPICSYFLPHLSYSYGPSYTLWVPRSKFLHLSLSVFSAWELSQLSWELAHLSRYSSELYSTDFSVGSCWPAGEGIWEIKTSICLSFSDKMLRGCFPQFLRGSLRSFSSNCPYLQTSSSTHHLFTVLLSLSRISPVYPETTSPKKLPTPKSLSQAKKNFLYGWDKILLACILWTFPVTGRLWLFSLKTEDVPFFFSFLSRQFKLLQMVKGHRLKGRKEDQKQTFPLPCISVC